METSTITSIIDTIKKRRSVFPASYTNQVISKETLLEILETANYAPTHRLTEPWRFKVIGGEALGKLGDLLATWYKENASADKFSEVKYKKTAQKPRKSSHMIAICMQRDPQEREPEWEEVASVAMAVQNMWLTASALGVGAYWSSPKSIHSEACAKFLNLGEGETCLGFLYMGYHELPEIPARRNPMAEKIEWISS